MFVSTGDKGSSCLIIDDKSVVVTLRTDASGVIEVFYVLTRSFARFAVTVEGAGDEQVEVSFTDSVQREIVSGRGRCRGSSRTAFLKLGVDVKFTR